MSCPYSIVLFLIMILLSNYHAKSGNSLIISFTLSRTLSITSSLSGLLITSSIRSTITGICSSFSPRVVMAGVPTRMPEVVNGERLSKGTMFLLMVISAFTKVFSATLPVISGNLDLQIDQHQVIVGSAGNYFISFIHKSFCHYLGILLYLDDVFHKFIGKCFAESNCF